MMNAPMVLSLPLKCQCSSSSTVCQSISRPGPSMKPSSDTDMLNTIFLIAVLVRLGSRGR